MRDTFPEMGEVMVLGDCEQGDIGFHRTESEEESGKLTPIILPCGDSQVGQQEGHTWFQDLIHYGT